MSTVQQKMIGRSIVIALGAAGVVFVVGAGLSWASRVYAVRAGESRAEAALWFREGIGWWLAAASVVFAYVVLSSLLLALRARLQNPVAGALCIVTILLACLAAPIAAVSAVDATKARLAFTCILPGWPLQILPALIGLGGALVTWRSRRRQERAI